MCETMQIAVNSDKLKFFFYYSVYKRTASSGHTLEETSCSSKAGGVTELGCILVLGDLQAAVARILDIVTRIVVRLECEVFRTELVRDEPERGVFVEDVWIVRSVFRLQTQDGAGVAHRPGRACWVND